MKGRDVEVIGMVQGTLKALSTRRQREREREREREIEHSSEQHIRHQKSKTKEWNG